MGSITRCQTYFLDIPKSKNTHPTLRNSHYVHKMRINNKLHLSPKMCSLKPVIDMPSNRLADLHKVFSPYS